METGSDSLRRHARDKAFYAYGTSRLFERRAQKLRRKRTWITFLGIAVPITVGGIVLSFGTLPMLMPYLIGIAGVVGVAQLILSVWSLVARRDEAYAYAIVAAQANTRLYNCWDAVAKRPPANLQERVDELDTEDERQEQSDIAQGISESEKRFAMRAALYYTGSECRVCKRKPTSMVPSDCDTCGNF